MKSMSILLIGEREGDAHMVQQIIDGATWVDPNLQQVVTLQQAFSLLDASHVDIILLMLPFADHGWEEVLEALQSNYSTIPVVVFTGEKDDDIALKALQKGAQDYLFKNRINEEIFQRTLSYAIERHRKSRKIEHLNLVLRTLRAINSLIVSEKDPQRLIQEACNKLVEIRGYDNAWITLTDDGSRIGGHAAAGPLGEKQLNAMFSQYETYGRCVQQALGTSQVLIFDRDEEGCMDCPLMNHHMSSSVMFKRLEYQHELLGVLWVCLPDEFAREKEEQSFFTEIAADLAFALYNMELEHQCHESDVAWRKTKARYRSLFSNVPIGLYVSRPDGTIVDANPALVRLLGFPDKDSLLQIHALDLYVDEKDRKKWRNLMKAHQEVYQFETVLRRYDGELIWILENTRSIVDQTGRVVRYEGSMQDITHSKKTLEKNDFLARLLRSVSQAIVATDPGGVISYWGNGAEYMFGWTAHDVIGWNINQVTIPDVSQRKAVDVMEALRNGYSWSGEMKLLRQGGALFDAIVSESPVFDEKGNLESIIGVYTDITNRKKAEQALEESEQKYRKLFESLPVGLYQSDPERRLLDVNHAALDIMGYKQSGDLIGKTLPGVFVHQEDHQEWLRLTQGNDQVQGYEVQLYHQNGSKRWVSLNSRTVRGQDGRVQYYEGSLEDITRRKEAESRIHRQIDEMKFLSESALELIQLTTPREIYQNIGLSIQRLIPGAAVVVSSFNTPNQMARVEAIHGLDHRWNELTGLLGQNPLGMQFAIDEKEQKRMLHRRFFRERDNTDPLIRRWLSVKATRKLMDAISLGSIYGMGLSRNQILFGTVNIGLPKGEKLKEEEVIQAYITQATIALHKSIAECQLQENERLLRRAQDIAHLGSWEIDLDTGQTTWSDELFRIFGYSPAAFEPTLEKEMQWIHPEDRPAVDQAHHNLFKQNTGYELEKRILQPDGSFRWVYSRGEMLYDAYNKPLKAVGVLLDITDRKIQEQKIQEQCKDMQFLSETALEMIQQTDPRQIYSYIAEQVLKLLGKGVVIVNSYDPQTDRYTIEHLEGLEDRMEQVVEILGSEPAGSVFQIERITTQKYMEPILQEYELNSTPVDQKDRYTKVDHQLIQQLGFHRYYAMGLAKDDQLLGTVTIMTPDNKKPQKLEVIQAFLIQSAITLQKVLAERELNQKNVVLEKMKKQLWDSNQELQQFNQQIEERQEQLQEAFSKAEESDRLKSAFLANLSHEIRTPMNAILGFAHLLNKKEMPDERKKQFIDIIHAKGEQLMQLINDIIDISKIQSHQFEIQPESFNLNHLFRQIELSYNSQMKVSHKEEKIDLRIKTSMKNGECQIVLDKHRLEQILNNLINNALKFTHKGFVEVGYLPYNQQSLLFYVQDTGIGIKKDKQGVVFDSFRQADERMNRDYGGTGLGLAIARNLVELMGGEIWVESVPGKGSTFYFTTRWEKGVVSPTDPAVMQVRERLDDWSQKTVLITEDDHANMLHLEELLKPTGIRMLKAADGEECLELLRTHPGTDLVLMDIKLPGMDGYEITRQIKQFDERIPVIAQTAYAMKGDRETLLQAGCDDYLPKPIDKESLLEVLNRYFTV